MEWQYFDGGLGRRCGKGLCGVQWGEETTMLKVFGTLRRFVVLTLNYVLFLHGIKSSFKGIMSLFGLCLSMNVTPEVVLDMLHVEASHLFSHFDVFKGAWCIDKLKAQ